MDTPNRQEFDELKYIVENHKHRQFDRTKELDLDYLTDADIGVSVQAYDAELAQIAGLADPNADRILFWDDSAGSYAHLSVGTGLSISGTTLSGSITTDNIQAEYTASKAVTGFTPVRPTTATYVYQTNNGTGYDNPIVGAADASNDEMGAVRFTVPTGGGQINSITASLKKTGSPADNYFIQIQADSSNQPSGSSLHQSDNVAASGVSTSYSGVVFSFSTEPLLAAGTYWAVIQRSGGNDTTNYLNFQTTATFSATTPGDGSWARRRSSTWTTFAVNTPNPNISINYIGGTSGEILPADAIIAFSSGVIGIIDESRTAGQAGTVVSHGLLDGFSGLIRGAVYYLADGGGIGAAPGTNSVKVGIAVTTTKMLINL